jgi:hypothetical protein
MPYKIKGGMREKGRQRKGEREREREIEREKRLHRKGDTKGKRHPRNDSKGLISN